MVHNALDNNEYSEIGQNIQSRCTAFVLLPYQLDIDKWEANYTQGKVPDKTPYGYHHAENDGFSVRLSKSFPDRSRMHRLLRRTAQKILGFDFLHAWQQRKEILASDVVWSHTEKEHLAVALLFMLTSRPRAKQIAQSVWLFDKWRDFSWIRQEFYKTLLRQACILTVHSPENKAIADSLGLPVQCKVMKFGTSMEAFPLKQRDTHQFHGPIRILALGNDIDRDWNTFFEAVKDRSQFEVRVVSKNYPTELTSQNLSVHQGDLQQVKDFYAWADVVVVPLRRNYHASGITVLLEAISSGLPVIASNIGGLEAYFDDDEVLYVPVGDSVALREAVMQLDGDPEACRRMTQKAQQRLLQDEYTSHGYALRHREISLELLGGQLCV